MTKKIVYRNKKLSYLVTGTGPTVVLIHGFGEDGDIWKEQVSFLQPFFQMIVPHLPGSGTSEVNEDMSIEGLAESIRFILDEENVQKCIMIGHSMGGYITLAFAEKYDHLLSGFGLFHSTAFADSEEKIETRRKSIELIKEKGAYAFLETTTPNLYSTHSKENKAGVIESHISSVHYFSTESLIAYYQAMIQRPDRTRVLKQNKIPILFVLGRGDSVVPLEDGLQQAHLPNNSFVHILENSGHMGMVEEAEKSCALLKQYLSDVS